MSIIKKQLKKLPENPGVYFFLGKNDEILYIGKATSLKDRVTSYFHNDLMESRGALIVQMIPLIKKIDWRQTDSVLEALLLEADLIKKFKPKHNTKEKDDKSYNCVVVTKEEFPRVLVVRKKDLENVGKKLPYIIDKIFGPFTNGTNLKNALKITRRLFQFRDRCIPYAELEPNKKIDAKICFNAQIGLCPGVCIGVISKSEYKKTIGNLKLFFTGKKNQILKNLEKEMRALAKNKEFEKAGKIKKQIFALNHIQDIALLNRHKNEIGESSNSRIESYDIAHLGGKETVGVMTVVTNGVIDKNEYRKFKIKNDKFGSDTHALKELLTRRLRHTEWPFPNFIVVDGGIAQKNLFEEIIAEHNLKISVIAVQKDFRHKPENLLGDHQIVEKYKSEIILANNESHRFAITYHKNRRNKAFLP